VAILVHSITHCCARALLLLLLPLLHSLLLLITTPLPFICSCWRWLHIHRWWPRQVQATHSSTPGWRLLLLLLLLGLLLGLGLLLLPAHTLLWCRPYCCLPGGMSTLTCTVAGGTQQHGSTLSQADRRWLL
jgi:hypothetical protein